MILGGVGHTCQGSLWRTPDNCTRAIYHVIDKVLSTGRGYLSCVIYRQDSRKLDSCPLCCKRRGPRTLLWFLVWVIVGPVLCFCGTLDFLSRSRACVHWVALPPPLRLFWRVLSARVNRLSDGRELTMSAGRLAKSPCPLSQFCLGTSVPRLMYVNKNGIVDTIECNTIEYYRIWIIRY